MNRFIATVVAFVSVTSAHAAGDPAKAQGIVNQVCAACHGVDGSSPLPTNPSLAGQHPEYLLKQMMEFKSGARSNPVMAAMVANLSPDDMRNLAEYYASQIPKQMSAKDKDLVTQGRKLYRGGNSSLRPAQDAILRTELEFPPSIRDLPASMPIMWPRS
jgi:cytochrome c553